MDQILDQIEKAEKIDEMIDMYVNNFSIEKHREYQKLVNAGDFTRHDIDSSNDIIECHQRYNAYEAIDRQMACYSNIKRKGIFSRIKSWIS